MQEEITRVFAMPFGLTTDDILAGERVKFSYLQRTGGGARSLCVPSVTSEFKWSGRQVSTLAKSGSVIYILSEQEIPVVSYTGVLANIRPSQYPFYAVTSG